jgi:hypothetical protein
MYRYSALMDRVEGKDANALVQSYSDILPGRPTSIERLAPRIASSARAGGANRGLDSRLRLQPDSPSARMMKSWQRSPCARRERVLVRARDAMARDRSFEYLCAHSCMSFKKPPHHSSKNRCRIVDVLRTS